MGYGKNVKFLKENGEEDKVQKERYYAEPRVEIMAEALNIAMNNRVKIVATAIEAKINKARAITARKLKEKSDELDAAGEEDVGDDPAKQKAHEAKLEKLEKEKKALEDKQ